MYAVYSEYVAENDGPVVAGYCYVDAVEVNGVGVGAKKEKKVQVVPVGPALHADEEARVDAVDHVDAEVDDANETSALKEQGTTSQTQKCYLKKNPGWDGVRVSRPPPWRQLQGLWYRYCLSFRFARTWLCSVAETSVPFLFQLFVHVW